MENEDLIKKLESIELPEIEIPSHKSRLRGALLTSDYFQKPSFFETLKRPLVLTAPALALLIFLGVTIIQPKLNETRALTIAKNNSEIKKLLEDQNMILGEVKVKDGKAYVLLNPLEEIKPLEEKNQAIKIQKVEKEEIEGAMVEINLNQKEVTKINPLKGEDIIPLANQEIESAQEIAKTEEIIKEIIPKEAKIEKIQPSLPAKMHLVEKDEGVEIISPPETVKRAKVYYIFDGREWIVKVNLNEKRVEEIKYSSSNQNFKGRK